MRSRTPWPTPRRPPRRPHPSTDPPRLSVWRSTTPRSTPNAGAERGVFRRLGVGIWHHDPPKVD
ncbi:hypothetical protein ACFFX0_15245 [Citricoccus parietis]|uniref:Uncharacterized protein n=1 Tax=Citricoccus parietis TaxID=592307 RepID=A0ABV5G0L7_9MICC